MGCIAGGDSQPGNVLEIHRTPWGEYPQVNLSVDEWRVVSYVNPRNTMHQISQTIHIDDLKMRKIVFSLLQAGLVEIIRPGGMPVLPREKMFPTKNPVEQKSMLKPVDHANPRHLTRRAVMQTVKIVVTGPFNSGKTEFIRSVSEIDVVATERKISSESERSVKETTTVAMDFWPDHRG